MGLSIDITKSSYNYQGGSENAICIYIVYYIITIGRLVVQ